MPIEDHSYGTYDQFIAHICEKLGDISLVRCMAMLHCIGQFFTCVPEWQFLMFSSLYAHFE
jgi:hypothetical protein